MHLHKTELQITNMYRIKHITSSKNKIYWIHSVSTSLLKNKYIIQLESQNIFKHNFKTQLKCLIMTENLTQWKALFFIAMSSLNFSSLPPFFFCSSFFSFFISSCKRSYKIFNDSLKVMWIFLVSIKRVN